MEDLRSPGNDQFGRKYPDKVVLHSGEILYGQISLESEDADGNFVIKIFSLIENLDDWIQNRIQYGTKKISINGSDIKEISTFDDY